MKYPLDQATFNELNTHLISHANMQTVLIQKLVELLGNAMDATEDESTDQEWYKESDELLNDLKNLKIDHDNRRWNDENLKRQAEGKPKNNLPAVRGPQKVVMEKIPHTNDHIVGLPTLQFDPHMNAKANHIEAKAFGEEMSEADLQKHFRERPKKKVEEKKTLDKMSIEEIESWERAQDNSNDIYKIKARVANLARGGGASLTAQGEMMVNTYVHVLKALYDFSEKIEDSTIKINLIKLIRANEDMPANLIAAAGAGVKAKK